MQIPLGRRPKSAIIPVEPVTKPQLESQLTRFRELDNTEADTDRRDGFVRIQEDETLILAAVKEDALTVLTCSPKREASFFDWKRSRHSHDEAAEGLTLFRDRDGLMAGTQVAEQRPAHLAEMVLKMQEFSGDEPPERYTSLIQEVLHGEFDPNDENRSPTNIAGTTVLSRRVEPESHWLFHFENRNGAKSAYRVIDLSQEASSSWQLEVLEDRFRAQFNSAPVD